MSRNHVYYWYSLSSYFYVHTKYNISSQNNLLSFDTITIFTKQVIKNLSEKIERMPRNYWTIDEQLFKFGKYWYNAHTVDTRTLFYSALSIYKQEKNYSYLKTSDSLLRRCQIFLYYLIDYYLFQNNKFNKHYA